MNTCKSAFVLLLLAALCLPQNAFGNVGLPESADGAEAALAPSSDDEPFAALAFKIATDPYVGKLTFFRVYSGVLDKGSAVLNSTKGKHERIGRIVQMHANARKELEKVWNHQGVYDTRAQDIK